ncbi:hypothetical protein PRIPAC_87407 [Pristionchus pacificus]|uniref:F-box domain-containing protein n=1 Tax=Pristionchus pacificus TaxID=54126 RepID=A0A2A6B8B0_PRIPA|nr:hypothetical protein PRIPAC_87407 [Pristionchus pacificus]|eukprot:PDM62120.1 hypothetical protein PRIPAC_51562 [Pristionchus pacificus]
MNLGCLPPDVIRIILPKFNAFEMDDLRLISPLWNSLVLEQFRRRDPSTFIAIYNVDWTMDTDKRGNDLSLNISKKSDRKFDLANCNNAFPKYYVMRETGVLHHHYEDFRFISLEKFRKSDLLFGVLLCSILIISHLNFIFLQDMKIYTTCLLLVIACNLLPEDPIEVAGTESKESRELKRIFAHGSWIKKLRLDPRVADMETFERVRQTLGSIPIRKVFLLGISMDSGEDPCSDVIDFLEHHGVRELRVQADGEDIPKLRKFLLDTIRIIPFIRVIEGHPAQPATFWDEFAHDLTATGECSVRSIRDIYGALLTITAPHYVEKRRKKAHLRVADIFV